MYRFFRATRWAAFAACLFASGAVHGQATRTWVSGVGDDVNPCSRTAPCRTFAGAISKTAAGGQISVLDANGYGTVTINKSMTIDGFGKGASILSSFSAGAITINIPGATGAERVVLRGLSIDGAGSTPGVDGIRVLSGVSVLLEDVAIQNLSGDGIEVDPAAGAAAHVVVRNTSIHNAATAVRVDGTASPATVELEDVVLARGATGVLVQAGGTAHARGVRASDFSASAFAAETAGSAAELSLERCAATASGSGVLASGASALATLSECSIAFNGTGIATDSGGQVHSFGNNRVHGNAANDGPTAEVGQQ